jgi:hypothetical protein
VREEEKDLRESGEQLERETKKLKRNVANSPLFQEDIRAYYLLMVLTNDLDDITRNIREIS